MLWRGPFSAPVTSLGKQLNRDQNGCTVDSCFLPKVLKSSVCSRSKSWKRPAFLVFSVACVCVLANALLSAKRAETSRLGQRSEASTNGFALLELSAGGFSKHDALKELVQIVTEEGPSKLQVHSGNRSLPLTVQKGSSARLVAEELNEPEAGPEAGPETWLENDGQRPRGAKKDWEAELSNKNDALEARRINSGTGSANNLVQLQELESSTPPLNTVPPEILTRPFAFNPPNPPLPPVPTFEPRLGKNDTSARESIAAPIRVAVMTAHYLGSWERPLPGCEYGGIPLDCEFVRSNTENVKVADALWYHAPHVSNWKNFARHHPRQLLIVCSMESDANYPHQNSPAFLSNFDLRMTYHLDADVVLLSFYPSKFLFSPPAPFQEKIDGVSLIMRNCDAPTKRTDIYRELMELGVRVDSYGDCLRNMPSVEEVFRTSEGPNPSFTNKLRVMRAYKFCNAMENTISRDYVTEKVFHALEAGCIPIYRGAPNIADFLPDPNAILDYDAFGSPAALASEMERLIRDRNAYEAKLAWKRKRFEDFPLPFQRLVRLARMPDAQCQVCKKIARRRLDEKGG